MSKAKPPKVGTPTPKEKKVTKKTEQHEAKPFGEVMERLLRVKPEPKTKQ